MVAPDEKAKRQAIKQALRQAEQERFRATLPLSPELLGTMFDFVDQQLAQNECDNTFEYLFHFLSEHQIEANAVVHWLENLGGYCDCEILANVEARFLEDFLTPTRETRF
ncbi:MAG: Protein of uncharacterized function [Candidatus Angelobacter sp.]|nr:Protein of uncharacterized function [Candidatus Angelobacter sp.]